MKVFSRRLNVIIINYLGHCSKRAAVREHRRNAVSGFAICSFIFGRKVACWRRQSSLRVERPFPSSFPRDVISLTPRATSRERNGFNNNTSRRLRREIGNFTFSPRLKLARKPSAPFPVPEIERRKRQERDIFPRDTRVHVFTRLWLEESSEKRARRSAELRLVKMRHPEGTSSSTLEESIVGENRCVGRNFIRMTNEEQSWFYRWIDVQLNE